MEASLQIVMEFLDVGSLLDVLRLGDHRIPISVLKAVAKQVLEAKLDLALDNASGFWLS